MGKSNQISLSYKDNEELKAALDGAEVGTRVTCEVTFMLTNKTDEYADGDVEEVTVESAESEDTETDDGEECDEPADSKSAKSDGASPVAVIIASRGKSKK